MGKCNKEVSLISAYIAVKKGTHIGIESLYAQQVTVYEQHCKKAGKLPKKDFCPRIHAIKRLDELIESLQQQHHAIILISI
jgi:hypothetical protein